MRVFKFESPLFKISVECINFDDDARVVITVPLSTVSLDILNEFQNEIENVLHVSCITNISIEKNRFILVLSLKGK
jgi:hypothetical protein